LPFEMRPLPGVLYEASEMFVKSAYCAIFHRVALLATLDSRGGKSPNKVTFLHTTSSTALLY
jgi:hypothetical protein